LPNFDDVRTTSPYWEPGVGKSAIAEGLLANHTKEKCQESCLTSVVTLDLQALLLELNIEDSLKNVLP
jgi:ATP-dependent Clp protease ATP-binding subunit ClpA